MAAKFLVLCGLVAVASAGLVPVGQVAYAQPEAPAHYEFQYSVQDGHTGDVKQQQEARAGDAVHGSYSLVQPDGVQRIVDYTADAVHGFNANVRYEGHPVAAPAKIAYAAPVAKLAYSSPVSYAAPAARVAYSSPLSYAAPVARVAYSSPLSYAAPVAKVAYAAPLAQFLVLCGLVAVASAGLVPVGQVAYAQPEAPAHYEFQYSVQDGHTGDVKQQQEARAGDAVHGSYSLVQPDGVHRIVDYTADAVHGFNANVRYEGHPVAAPAKIAYAAPVAKLAYSSPVSYAAPAARVAYSSPLSYAAPVARVAYSSPLSYAAPVAKVAYAAPLAQVSFSSPAISYHH
ncbi:cuticle protein 18.6-like [Maniola hyperantus]|uniref:cuticle protein 18.6-like n=1 Tax=Aphantopus hyperantus TaxID=2795564 RepID=UPI00374945CF